MENPIGAIPVTTAKSPDAFRHILASYWCQWKNVHAGANLSHFAALPHLGLLSKTQGSCFFLSGTFVLTEISQGKIFQAFLLITSYIRYKTFRPVSVRLSLSLSLRLLLLDSETDIHTDNLFYEKGGVMKHIKAPAS